MSSALLDHEFQIQLLEFPPDVFVEITSCLKVEWSSLLGRCCLVTSYLKVEWRSLPRRQTYAKNLYISSAFGEVLESSFHQFWISWYIFFFQLPYISELWLKAWDYMQVEEWFNGQHLPGVSRKVVQCHKLECLVSGVEHDVRVGGCFNSQFLSDLWEINFPARIPCL